jgi:hypothetical protein
MTLCFLRVVPLRQTESKSILFKKVYLFVIDRRSLSPAALRPVSINVGPRFQDGNITKQGPCCVERCPRCLCFASTRSLIHSPFIKPRCRVVELLLDSRRTVIFVKSGGKRTSQEFITLLCAKRPRTDRFYVVRDQMVINTPWPCSDCPASLKPEKCHCVSHRPLYITSLIIQFPNRNVFGPALCACGIVPSMTTHSQTKTLR